jgi:hypothetical protein
VGNGSVQNIKGTLTVNGPYFSPTLKVDDSLDMTAQTVTITSQAITGLGAPINCPSYFAGLRVSGGPGGEKVTANGLFNQPVTFQGKGSANTLVVPTATNFVLGTIWTISTPNGGTVGFVTFTGVQNLVGHGADTFHFTASGSLSGKLDGGGSSGSWLDYSALTTAVTVNLATGAATGVFGGAPGGVSNIQNVIGSAGNDILVGNAQGNILIGGAGANAIMGGSGRSVLIGGTGPSTIVGGSGDDILIAGTTTFDANETALLSILQEWQRTDRTASQRIADLRNGGGYNGSNTLVWGTTVLDNDVGVAHLTGGGGSDWFFANLAGTGIKDVITDLNISDTVN